MKSNDLVSCRRESLIDRSFSVTAASQTPAAAVESKHSYTGKVNVSACYITTERSLEDERTVLELVGSKLRSGRYLIREYDFF